MSWGAHSGGDVQRRWRRRRALFHAVLAALLATAFGLASATLAGGSEPRDTYETTIAADSPVAQYRFEDASEAATLADAAGSNTATNHGIVLGGAGPFGGSASGLLSGEAYASLSSNPLEGATEFTAEAWVYWSGEGSYEEPIFDFGSSATNHIYLTPAASAGSHDLTLELHTTEGASAQVTAPEFGEGAWHYVAATESSAGELKLYLDGAEVGHSTEAAVSPASLDSAATAYLGKSLGAAPDFKGRLSNVAFYTKALSAAAIKAHYDAGEFPVNTTTPTISGTVEDEQTLTAHAETWTGLEPIEFGYQWQRCNGTGEGCANISGATSSTYKTEFVDVGHKLRVRLTGTNTAGSGEALSPASAFVAPTPLTELGYASEFGTEGSGDGQFKEPVDVAVSSNGDIFVLDWGNARVEKFNEAGEYLSQFASAGSGEGQLKEPRALAIDSEGHVYVLDTGNERVEEFDEAGEFLRTIGSGLIGSAEGISVDRAGHIWVADSSAGHLAVFGKEGEHLKDVGSQGAEPGQLNQPAGLTVDAGGHVWVADDGNQRVERFNEAGEYLSEFGTEGAAAGRLSGPWQIAVDAGHIFLSELGFGRIQEFDEEGGFIAQLGVPGSEAGDLGFPGGLAISPAHDLLVADISNNRVQRLSPEAGGAPADLSPPSLSGNPGVGYTYEAGAGVWSGSPRRSYAFQWQRCDEHGEGCVDIEGATSPTYTIAEGDLGSTMRVVVTATNDLGSASSASAPSEVIVEPPANVSLPTVSGAPVDGVELTAEPGEWERASGYSYEWQRCNTFGEACVDTEIYWRETYTATEEDIGHTLRVIVTAYNGAGAASATSMTTAIVTAGPPPVNLSAPTITGAGQEGRTLSAQHGAWESPEPISYGYQWQTCNEIGTECEDIPEATEDHYLLGAADEQTTARVVVTASNTHGASRAVSSASAVIEGAAPVEVQAPSIAGTAITGGELQADPGQWEGGEVDVRYQWERCNSEGRECNEISGATAARYSPTEEDAGHTARVVVGASNSRGSVTAISTASPTLEEATLQATYSPSLAGTPEVGRLLWVEAGSWLGSSTIEYAYQWQRCDRDGVRCIDITGATSSTYVLTSPDAGGTVRALVTAADTSDGSVSQPTSASKPIAAEGAPLVEAEPAAEGPAFVGEDLSATAGTWSSSTAPSFTDQWERCDGLGEECTAITGAGEETYTLTSTDANSSVRVAVTATASGAATEAASFPRSVSGAALSRATEPTIVGWAEAGQELTANPGIWTGAGEISYSYQWQRCDSEGGECSPISGATDASYIPRSADGGDTLRVAVIATRATEVSTATSAATSEVSAEPTPPESLSTPSVEGDPTAGATLTVNPGSWSGVEPISYSLQWQSCDENGEACTDILGATGETYLLAVGDIATTLRVIVTATNSLGETSATSSQTDVIGAAGPPANTEAPSIQGTARAGERLFGDNGGWTGSRPLSYQYSWQRCDGSGESCAPIEGATTPSYTATSSDVASTLRLNVITSNVLGTVAASSEPTSVVAASSEASTSEALEVAEATDPSILAPATSASLEGETIRPATGDTREALSSEATLTSSSTSKETPGEFAVNTPDGELSLAPVDTAPTATTSPTLVNGTAALFAGTSAQTDTIIRPDPLGATALLQMRSASAPTSFSWEVRLGAEEKLQPLSDGSVAVVEPASASFLEGELSGEPMGGPGSEAGVEAEGEAYGPEGANEELGGALEESTEALEALPAAPTATTPEVLPKTGELHPQDTNAQYEAARHALSYSEASAEGTVRMVVETPTVMDAAGEIVPATLSVDGNDLKLTIMPSGTTTYPATAALSLAAVPDATSAATAPAATLGLSDEQKSPFEEDVEEGKEFDPKLRGGRLGITSARLIIDYDSTPSHALLHEWLEAVQKAKLKPFVTFRACVPEAVSYTDPNNKPPCPSEPAPASTAFPGYYYNHVYVLMKELIKDGVRTFGAWNEPDKYNDPLHKHSAQAAVLWGEAERAAIHLGCRYHCIVVAGEFAGYKKGYVGNYLATILRNAKRGIPSHVKATTWSLHDYNDLLNVQAEKSGGHEVIARTYRNTEAQDLVRFVKRRRIGSTHVWMSEQGVQISTSIGDGTTRLTGHTDLQRLAAQDFLRLARPSEHIERVNYFGYRGLSAERLKILGEKGQHDFDSAMLAGDGVTTEPTDRPAYCVLALDHNDGCPAVGTTGAPVPGSVSTTAAQVSATVYPEGLPTSYWVEYGPTTAYEKSTAVSSLPNADGAQSETVVLDGFECVGSTTIHYRVVAANEANEETPSFGEDKTLSLPCESKEEEEAKTLHGTFTITYHLDKKGPKEPISYGIGGIRKMEALPAVSPKTVEEFEEGKIDGYVEQSISQPVVAGLLTISQTGGPSVEPIEVWGGSSWKLSPAHIAAPPQKLFLSEHEVTTEGVSVVTLAFSWTLVP